MVQICLQPFCNSIQILITYGQICAKKSNSQYDNISFSVVCSTHLLFHAVAEFDGLETTNLNPTVLQHITHPLRYQIVSVMKTQA